MHIYELYKNINHYKLEKGNTVFSRARERSVNVSEPESLELMVSNLKPEETYSFRVIAYNDVGPGESSARLKITTKPDRKRHAHSCTHTHMRDSSSHIYCQTWKKDKSTEPYVNYQMKIMVLIFWNTECIYCGKQNTANLKFNSNL